MYHTFTSSVMSEQEFLGLDERQRWIVGVLQQTDELSPVANPCDGAGSRATLRPAATVAGQRGGVSVPVDVVVVGGGPAGASAAYFLARRGWSVVVLEQKRFPRDKTCGDGLTPRSIKVLDDMGLGTRMREWPRVFGVRIGGAGTTRVVGVPRTRRWCDYGLVVPRRVLDQAVLDNAESAGATVRYGTKALHPVVEGDAVRGVIAEAAGKEVVVHARWTVCAEGAAGTLRRCLGHAHNPHHPMGLALRQYCAPGPERLDWFDVHVDLRDRRGLLPGYGWAFPIGQEAVNVGVGLLHTPGGVTQVNLHAQLDRFVARLSDRGIVDGDAPARDRRGGRLFMGSSLWPPHGRGYVFVGDAAGMINPATGEGIAYALETGRIAARRLHVALQTGRQDLSSYGRELRRVYGTYYRMGRGLVASLEDPARMEHVVGRTMTSQRRLRFATSLLLNLDDTTPRSLDQLGARSLAWLAGVAGWAPWDRHPGADARAANRVSR